jgi:NADH:ubiquinone oxidoreductase subunit K
MAHQGTRPVSAGLVGVLFVAAALVAAGAFATTWRRDMTSALAGIPVMFGGAGVAFVGVARFAAAPGPQLLGQEVAVLVAVAALALVALGIGIAGREGTR